VSELENLIKQNQTQQELLKSCVSVLTILKKHVQNSNAIGGFGLPTAEIQAYNNQNKQLIEVINEYINKINVLTSGNDS